MGKTDGKLVYTASEAAEALGGISLPTLYSLLRRDDFPSFRIGRRIMVSVAGLEAWVQREAMVDEKQQFLGSV